MSMFCFQCQEASKGEGCTIKGICGKTDDVANLQDLLVFVTKGISIYAQEARQVGIEWEPVNRFVFDALFMTITNANFDKTKIEEKIREGLKLRTELKNRFEAEGGKLLNTHESVTWEADTLEAFEEKAANVGVLSTANPDVRSLRELIVYGVKGMAAYAEHAFNLGYEKKELYAFMQKALAATTDDTLSVDDLVALTMETGKYGVDVMALLDQANTESYGNPEITEVNLGVQKNPGILVSGHDLKDFEELLKQTEGTGVDIYTHSEMLPANYYPAFKKYEHFVGNYGNAWWKQKEEFEAFKRSGIADNKLSRTSSRII